MKFLTSQFRSLSLGIVLVFSLACGVTAPVCRASSTDAVIQVGSETEFPPFAVVDQEGKAAGFSIDLIQAVARAMGLSIAVTTGPWDTMWNGLVSGRIDVLPIVATLAERKRLVDFSLPHTETFDAFFVRDGSQPLQNIGAAEGKTVIVMRSDAAHHALLELKFPGETVLVDTIPEGLALLASGKHDAFLCSKLIGTLTMEKYGMKGIFSGPIIPDYKRVFAFGVKKGADELREKLNQGLLIVKASGEYDRIYEKWLMVGQFVKSTPLKTSIVKDYPPYTFLNEKDMPDGFTVDLAKAVAEVMGMELEIKADTWHQAVSDLQSGRIDFLPMMAYSKERDRIFEFSGPHTIGHDAFFTRKDGKKIRSVNDLHGKRIIVMENDQAHDFVLNTGAVNDNQLILIDSLPDALRLLSAGKGDVALMPKLVGLIQIQNLNLTNLTLSPLVVDTYSRPFSFAVREGNQELLEKLSQGLNIVKATGQYQEIYNKWFGRLEPAGISFETAFTYAIVGIFGFLVVGVVLLAWSVTLRRQVRAHTRDLKAEILERKRAEADLSRINENLAAKNAEIEQMIYVASHDLRTPLVNIDGYSKELGFAIQDLLRAIQDVSGGKPSQGVSHLVEQDIPEALRFIRSSTAKMDTLLTGLLRLSRLGRAALTIEALDMNGLIGKVIDATEFNIKKAGVRLDVSSLPPCMGDAAQVSQIFSNLLDNALKYLDPQRPGVIRITGWREETQSVYCVEDNGIGIASAHLDKIFELFQRIDPGRVEGEGLGLTIVKRGVGRLKGAVRVESDVGSGSRFYVALPVEQL